MIRLIALSLSSCFWLFFTTTVGLGEPLCSASQEATLEPGESFDLTGFWQDEDGANYHVSQKVDRVYMLVDELPQYLRAFYGSV